MNIPQNVGSNKANKKCVINTSFNSWTTNVSLNFVDIKFIFWKAKTRLKIMKERIKRHEQLAFFLFSLNVWLLTLAPHKNFMAKRELCTCYLHKVGMSFM
jgi:hypothetical protein